MSEGKIRMAVIIKGSSNHKGEEHLRADCDSGHEILTFLINTWHSLDDTLVHFTSKLSK